MNKGLIGLKNRGNTCYLNTSIQCLSNIKLLREYFISNHYLSDLNDRYDETKEEKMDEMLFAKEFSKLIKALWCANSSIDPVNFHKIIQKSDERFAGFYQQDSQEALSFILDTLHEGLKYNAEINYKGKIQNSLDKVMVQSIKNWKNDFSKKYSIIVELFFGQYINKIVPNNDNKNNKILSKKFEIFSILSVPIYGKTLYESLEKYFEKETLDSKYLHEKTNEYIDACRQIKLMKVPKYLIIVLKRYKNNNGVFTKSNNSITFPIDDLDLSTYCEGYDKIVCNLKLISIGCHIGSLDGGHYFAVCRRENNNWYKYDDETVSEYSISSNNIFKEGYILIYEKIDS